MHLDLRCLVSRPLAWIQRRSLGQRFRNLDLAVRTALPTRAAPRVDHAEAVDVVVAIMIRVVCRTNTELQVAALAVHRSSHLAVLRAGVASHDAAQRRIARRLLFLRECVGVIDGEADHAQRESQKELVHGGLLLESPHAGSWCGTSCYLLGQHLEGQHHDHAADVEQHDRDGLAVALEVARTAVTAAVDGETHHLGLVARAQRVPGETDDGRHEHLARVDHDHTMQDIDRTHGVGNHGAEKACDPGNRENDVRHEHPEPQRATVAILHVLVSGPLRSNGLRRCRRRVFHSILRNRARTRAVFAVPA